MKLKVCVIGGGNAAHACMALFPFKGIETKCLATYQDEAKRINEGLKEQGFIRAIFAEHNDPKGVVDGVPIEVSDDPSIVSDCNVLLLPLPTFAFEGVLRKIAKYIAPGTFIAATPGQGGFDWIARYALGELREDLTFFTITGMPFNCRIQDYGKLVQVQQLSRAFQVAAVPESRAAQCAEITSRLFGPAVSIGHIMTATLAPLNANIHPMHCYTLLKNYKMGDTFDKNPLFYETMSVEDDHWMEAVSSEVQKIAAVLRRKTSIHCHPETIYESECLRGYWAPEMSPSEVFRTSPAYKNFTYPFMVIPNPPGTPVNTPVKYAPNFASRYFTEDIPYGLCVWKGLADICGVKAPSITRLIEWAQPFMGKEYIVDGKLAGKDVAGTSAPQRYGIFSIDQLKLGTAGARGKLAKL